MDLRKRLSLAERALLKIDSLHNDSTRISELVSEYFNIVGESVESPNAHKQKIECLNRECKQNDSNLKNGCKFLNDVSKCETVQF